MKVTADLPHEWKGFNYVKNHHFIQIEDQHGHSTKLNATGVLVGTCQEAGCGQENLALHMMDEMACTYCRSKNVKWKWHRPQLAFIPEQESEFVAWQKPNDTPSGG